MRFALVAAVLCLLGLSAPAFADSMRCGARVVTSGDTRAQVRQFCGEPSDVQTRTILRRPYYDFHGRFLHYGDGVVEVPVEIWTYNFGPYRLMRRLKFVDGVLDQIETLGYGYYEQPG